MDFERIANLNRKGEWVARCNGAGTRPYFCFNERTREYHYGESGTLIRYTLEGAVKKAEELNDD